MLYNKNQYFMFSLLAAENTNYGRYNKPLIKLHLLIKIFKNSIEDKKNIFELSDDELNVFIEETFDKNNRYYSNRVKNSKNVFLDKKIINKIRKQSDIERMLCKEHKISFLTYEDKNYPDRFKNIDLSPIMIFYKGQLPKDKELKNSYAVIGSRDIDKKGKQIAYLFGKLLSENNYWNISGLAEGSDAYGHLGSIQTNGLTGAILAHGLAEAIYPSNNKNLAEKILKKDGFLMSELPPSTKIQKHFFTRRDRLQSGLTKGVFVVETGKKGGTLHTVDYAIKQNKFVGVWEPSNYEESNEHIKGNLMLLRKIKTSKKFKIKSINKLNKIKPIKDKKDILKILNKNYKRESLFDV